MSRGSVNPEYTPYHPRWYRRRMPIFWWLRKSAYTRFISRELTSVFVAYAAVLLLVQGLALTGGPEAYDRFLSWLRTPPVLGLNFFALIALLFHTVTWLNLAPSALVLRFGGRRVPGAAIIAANYLAWAAISAFVVWLLVGR